jgi:hypothetical protein
MSGLPAFGEGEPTSVRAKGYLPLRLYGLPEQRDLYTDVLQEVLDSTWHEEVLLDKISAFHDVIAPHVLRPEEVEDQIEVVRAFVQGRRDDLMSELPFGGDWPYPLPGAPCLVDQGPIVVNFDTTWGTLESGADPFTTGSGDIDAVSRGLPVVASGGAIAGFHEGDQALVAVTVITGNELYQAIPLFRGDAVEGQDIPLNLFGETFGLLNWMDLTWMEEPVTISYISDGTLYFDALGTSPGDAVSGQLNARLVGGE